jgi:arsenate reductase
MAEGFTRSLFTNDFDAFSAGTEPQPVNQIAVKVMGEVGIDISTAQSKHIDALSDILFDVVITVCDNAAESCPIPPATTKLLHAPFDDPPRLAENAKSEEEVLGHYRHVRDKIKVFIQSLPKVLSNGSK